MTNLDDLHLALYEHCVNELYSIPPAWRERSCWVMNREWYGELRAMLPSAEQRALARQVGVPVSALWESMTHLLGIPYRVTESATVPRLITD